VVNSLFRKGAHVIYEGFEDLHVSGHAAREELKLLMAILRPRFFLPIHGEFKHLMHHAEIAKEMGVDERNIILAENGDVVTVDGNGISLNGTVKTGSVFIDGRSISDIESVVIRDRHRLAEEGILIVVISISLENQGMIPPEIFSQGFIHPKDAEDLFTRAKELVFDEVRRHLKGNAVDQEELKTSVTGVLKRFFTREMSRSPIIVPIVVEV
jgi:ribonuclease J